MLPQVVMDALEGNAEQPCQQGGASKEIERRQYGMDEFGASFAMHDGDGKFMEYDCVDAIQGGHEHQPVGHLPLGT